MGQGDWLDLSAVRREIHQDTYEVLESLVAAGWRLRRQGHKFLIYCCPCGADWVRVDGTPKNPTNQARRIRREAARCPDRHDRLPRGVSS